MITRSKSRTGGESPRPFRSLRAVDRRADGVAVRYRPSALSGADLVAGRLSDVRVLAADSQS